MKNKISKYDIDLRINNFFSRVIPGKIGLKTEIIFFSLIFVIFFLLSYNLSKDLWFPNTDNIQNYVFSEQFAKENNLVVKNDFNTKYEPSIFGLRGMIVKDDGTSVPTSMPGYIILTGLVRKISSFLTYFINPAFAILALLYLYKISQLVFNDEETKRSSFIVTILASISAPFLFVSNIPFNNIVSASFFLAGLFYILKIIKSENCEFSLKNLSLFALFAGLGLWIRHEILLFYIPAIIFLLVKIFLGKNRKYLLKNLRNMGISIAIFSIFIILFLIENKILFGSWLGFFSPSGTILGRSEEIIEKVAETSIWSRIFPFSSFSSIFKNLFNQVILVNPPIFILFLVSIYFAIKNKKDRTILIILILTILFEFWFFLAEKWSGVLFKASVGTSYTRYMISAWMLLNITAVYGIIWIQNRINLKNFVPVLFIFYFLFNLHLFLYSDMSYAYFKSTRLNSARDHRAYADNTSKKSIIFCRVSDRYIYPYKMTAIYSTIEEKDRAQKTVGLMQKLLKDGYEVYIIDEYQYMRKPNYKKDFEDIINVAESKNLKIIPKDFVRYLYQVTL